MSKFNLKSPAKRFYLLILVIIFAFVFYALERKNTINLFKDEPVSSTIPSVSPNDAPKSPVDESSKTPSEQNSPSTPDKIIPSTPSGELKEPSGTFISTHRITLNDPIYNNLESICITTPGASCSIAFKKGDVTKTLEAKTANNNGNVTWNWDPNKAGLTAGVWQIVVTANSGSNSKTTTDLQSLEVSK